MAKRSVLAPKQLLFVAEYLKHGNGTQAAIAAGYSKANAKQQAYQLLNHQPAVKAAIDEQRKKLQVAAGYNFEKAMKEADEAISLAEITGNANAFVKAVELKAKLNGLLIERHDVRQLAQFEIKISGIDEGKSDERSKND